MRQATARPRTRQVTERQALPVDAAAAVGGGAGDGAGGGADDGDGPRLLLLWQAAIERVLFSPGPRGAGSAGGATGGPGAAAGGEAAAEDFPVDAGGDSDAGAGAGDGAGDGDGDGNNGNSDAQGFPDERSILCN